MIHVIYSLTRVLSVSPLYMTGDQVLGETCICFLSQILIDSPVLINPCLDPVEISTLMVTVEIRFSTSMPTKTDKYRRNIAKTLKCNSESINTMINVHAILERIFCQPIGNAWVFSSLIPGKHSNHILGENSAVS
jgi:hypothetical protein